MAQDTTASPNFDTHPGTKVYTDAAGHQRAVEPHWSVWGQEWNYIYAFATCTDECRACGGGESLEEFAGERWEDDY